MNIWAALCTFSTSWHRHVGACFRRAWQSLNFYKEYLFGFETLVFVTSGILSIYAQTACNTPKRKQNLKSHLYDPFKTKRILIRVHKSKILSWLAAKLSSYYTRNRHRKHCDKWLNMSYSFPKAYTISMDRFETTFELYLLRSYRIICWKKLLVIRKTYVNSYFCNPNNVSMLVASLV